VSGFAFPRSRRLTRAAEYSDVFRHTQLNVSAGPLRIRARKNTLCRARLGLVVPKKGTAKAVRRNRIKRILRNRFRLIAEQLPAVDMVVQVFNDMDDQRLLKAFDTLLKQIAQSSELKELQVSNAQPGDGAPGTG